MMNNNHLTNLTAVERDQFLLHLITTSRGFVEFSYEEFKRNDVPDAELLAVEMACGFAPPPEVVEETPAPAEVETCCICLTDDAVMPCRVGNHKYACADCNENLRLTTDSRCPICRAPDVIDLIVPETQTPTEEEDGWDWLQSVLPYRGENGENIGEVPQVPYPNVWRLYGVEDLLINLVNHIDSRYPFAFRSFPSLKRFVAHKLRLCPAMLVRNYIDSTSFYIFTDWKPDINTYSIVFAYKTNGNSMYHFAERVYHHHQLTDNLYYCSKKRESTIINSMDALLSRDGCEKFLTRRAGCVARCIFKSEFC